MEKFGGPILQKYANINRSGKEAVLNENIVKFDGFSESIKDRFITAAIFDEYSLNQVEDRVLGQLKRLEDMSGIEFAMANRDYPLHSTIMEGEYKGENQDEKDDLFERLTDDLPIDIKGLEIKYDYILIDKGNVLLVAQTIPEAVLKARESLKNHYSESGLRPLLLENILHCSLARIKSLPTDFVPNKYIKELTDIRHSVSKSDESMILIVDRLDRGNSYNFLTQS